jgi:hypothetical protein
MTSQKDTPKLGTCVSLQGETMTFTSSQPAQIGIGFPCPVMPRHSIVRSDGRSFRLIAAAKPVSYPTANPLVEAQMFSIGFWYDRKLVGPLTEIVVVILRQPPGQPMDVMQQVEIVADRLAERLAKNTRLAATYEFDSYRSVLKAY